MAGRRGSVAGGSGGHDAVAAEPLGHVQGAIRGLTISIGVAAFPGCAETKEGLLEAADRALYVAKRLGRDRVVAAGPSDA